MSKFRIEQGVLTFIKENGCTTDIPLDRILLVVYDPLPGTLNGTLSVHLARGVIVEVTCAEDLPAALRTCLQQL